MIVIYVRSYVCSSYTWLYSPQALIIIVIIIILEHPVKEEWVFVVVVVVVFVVVNYLMAKQLQ